MTTNLAIYGAGITGRAIYKILKERGETPIAVFDSNPDLWGRPFDGGLLVSSPNRLHEHSGKLVVACAGGTSLRKNLHEAGISWIDYSLNWHYQWNHIALPLLDQNLEHTLERLKESLSDEESKRILNFVLNNPNPDSETLEKQEVCDDYFSAFESWGIQAPNVLVLGAHTGEEVSALSKRSRPPESLTLVEPDERARVRLTEIVKKFGLERITKIVPAAIGGQSGSGILSGEGPSRQVTRVGDATTTHTDSVFRTIDSFELGTTGRKAVITMDIEGYEIEALDGAFQTLQSGNVAWAISAYHRPHDLFHIFEAFEKSSISFEFHLRMLDFGIVDLTLFAIPKGYTSD